MSERRCNTHLAGEFFVAAELAKLGFNVSLTMGNAKAVDLFAEHEGRAVSVQVKALAHKRNIGWPVPLDPAKIIDGVIYVCVIVNDLGEPPTYFVMPPEEVRQRAKRYSTRAILDISRVRNCGFENAWHLIEDALRPASAAKAA